jgi:type I restriction enzyme, S subunit
MAGRALFKSWFVDFEPIRAKLEGRSTGLPENVAALFPDNFDKNGLPEGWQAITVQQLCKKIFSGGTPSTTQPAYWGGEHPWLSSGETRSNFIISTEKTVSQAGIDSSSTRLARKGSTVIASAGQGHTRGQTSTLMIDSYINQSVVVLQADQSICTDRYLYFDLERRYEQFRQLSDSQSSRGSLTTKLLAGVNTVLPTRAAIDAFDHFAAPAIDRIVIVLNEISSLARLRDTLHPKLISGELLSISLDKTITAA